MKALYKARKALLPYNPIYKPTPLYYPPFTFETNSLF